MKNKRLPAWELERYLLGELSRRRMEEIEKLIKENPEVRKEIESLQQSNQDILKQYPSDTVIPRIMRCYEGEIIQRKNKHEIKQINWRTLFYVTPVLASALILLFLVLHNNRTGLWETRIKGEENIDMTKTQILIYRKKGNEAEILKNGAQARAGDLLQIAYIAAGKGYGTILSIDGNGLVTLHYPEDKDGPTALRQEKRVFLGTSYELDDAPEFERFFFITAMRKINVQKILEIAEKMAESSDSAEKENLELSDTFNQFSILLKKGEGL